MRRVSVGAMPPRTTIRRYAHAPSSLTHRCRWSHGRPSLEASLRASSTRHPCHAWVAADARHPAPSGETRLGGVRGFTQALCQGLTCIECTKTGVCTTACTRCGSEHTLVPVLRTPPTFRVRRAGEAMQALAPVRCGLFVHISNPEVFQRTPALSLDHSRDPERRTGICQTLARTNTC
jgi:hypothetical protein